MKRNVKKVITLVLALVMVMGCMIQSADAATYNLDVSSVVDQGDLYSDVAIGNFTIKASDEKYVSVSSNIGEDGTCSVVGSDGAELPYTINLRGASATEGRKIEITITEKTSFKFYTRSNGGDERTLAIYDATSTEVDDAGKAIPLHTYPAVAKDQPAAVYEVELEPGSYYFASVTKAICVYDIIATDNSGAAAPETPAVPSAGESNMLYMCVLVCAAAMVGCAYFVKRRHA